MVEAVSVEAVGGGAKFDESAVTAAPTTRVRRTGRRTLLLTRALARRGGLSPELRCRHAGSRARMQNERSGHHHRAAPDHRRRGRLAGGGHGQESPGAYRASCRCERAHAIGTHADPVMLEVFNNLFMSIAEQMGVSLQNTAYSVNIKERLDFSCAVFAARRHAGRQRAAYAGASGLDGPLGRNHHPRQRRKNRARRRLRHQRALQRRHASSRHHRVHAGVRRQEEEPSCSGSPRAAITPMSAASRPARCRRTRRPSSRKASTSTISSWSTAAVSARRN